MRQFNLIGRGERESREHHLARIKAWLLALGLQPEQFASDDLLRYDVGCIEISHGTIRCIHPDGTVFAHIQATHDVLNKTQNFGGLGKAYLRLELDPMTEERAAKILAGIPTDARVCDLTAEQLDAFAFAAHAREKAEHVSADVAV